MLKFYYQVAVTVKPGDMELHLDGDVSGNTINECVTLIHKTGKETLLKTLKETNKEAYVDIGSIQTKMTMLVQVFEQPAYRVVPCA